MFIKYKTRKDQKLFTSRENLNAKYGPVVAKKIHRQIQQLENSQNLQEYGSLVPSCHSLRENLDGYVSVNLTGNLRLILEPEIPEGIPHDSTKWSKVTVVFVVSVEDYHGKNIRI